MKTYRYVPSLDGVRGLAIALVVLNHSAGPWFFGGAIGVDIFFVVSGFLITGILLSEWEQSGTISLRNFYARRGLRLLPALLVMLALVAALPWFFPPSTTVSKSTAMISTLLYVSNYVQTGAGHSLGSLGHTWSLAVEEQFYLIWPISMIWLINRNKLRTTLYWLIPAFMVVRAVGVGMTGLTGDGWLSSHADELLVGALLADLSREDRVRRAASRASIAWTGLAALTVLFVVMGIASRRGHANDDASYGVLSLVALSSAGLIAHLASGTTSSITRLFSLRPLRLLGRVSYGVYLYHNPIVNEIRHRVALSGHSVHSRFLGLILEFLLTAIVVAVSWRLVEQPALRLKRHFTSHRTKSDVERGSFASRAASNLQPASYCDQPREAT